MKKKTSIAVAVVLASTASLCWSQEGAGSGKNLGSVTGGDFKAMEIIEKRCTACHSSNRISSAVASRKNMAEIQKAMEKRGALLSSNEREVLGIYWKEHPLKEKGK